MPSTPLARRLLRSKRLRHGLCPSCGGVRDGDLLLCRSCLAKSNARVRRWYHGNPDSLVKSKDKARRCYHERVGEGKCPSCGHDIDDLKWKRCSACRQRSWESVHYRWSRELGTSKEAIWQRVTA